MSALPAWITSQLQASGQCTCCGERPADTEWSGTGLMICWTCCDAKRAQRLG
jgi:hypothetical protein